MNGILFIENFVENPNELFESLKETVIWDERMKARKTASFGKAYNYSQIEYQYLELLTELKQIITKLESVIGFEPNNCLINYYLNGKSKMGFHSDQTDILETNTGIAIISIGETRILTYRNIENSEKVIDYELTNGSLIYMTQEIQKEWQHAIPKSDTENGRMSLTFRKIK
jgi:alkylated DNA repair dioxygenase AlkB